MRIKQLFVSNSVAHFKLRLQQRYGLGPYLNPQAPTICFGCYPGDTSSIETILSHKDMLIMVWAGSDAMRLCQEGYVGLREQIMAKDNIRHIAISNFIHNDLDNMLIPHTCLAVSQVTEDLFKLSKLGNGIFIFNSNMRSSKKDKFYGVTRTRKLVAKHFPEIPIISGLSPGAKHDTHKIIPYTQMSRMYDQCFMGVRLTPHDGLPNTVVELGLMGRRCIWNGDLPNAIAWKNDNDIVDAIRMERFRIGKEFPGIRQQIIKHIDIGDAWLDTNFYRRTT